MKSVKNDVTVNSRFFRVTGQVQVYLVTSTWADDQMISRYRNTCIAHNQNVLFFVYVKLLKVYPIFIVDIRVNVSKISKQPSYLRQYITQDTTYLMKVEDLSKSGF